jgi:hypothetical protein
MKMKAAMILLVIACRMACGQSQPQSRQWLRRRVGIGGAYPHDSDR